jgi:hypothetical protein
MSRLRRPHAIFIHSLILLAFLAAASGVVSAQSTSVGMPENARARGHGSGWECVQGHREVDGACAAVKVPENAYPTNRSYGRGWECGHGFREIDAICAAIEVPATAYLNASGDGWECDRGYRKVDETCAAIRMPANAYLNASGGSCERIHGEFFVRIWLGVR